MEEYFCGPAITTAAIFVAILILDLIRANYYLLPGHSVAGAVSVLLMVVLCQKGASFAGWVLLSVPFLLVLAGWIIIAVQRGIEIQKDIIAELPAPVPAPRPPSTIYCPLPDQLERA
jgi:hypothetical protein